MAVMAQSAAGGTQKQPPSAHAKPVEDTYFGVTVSDPYRYMENLKDTTVQQWLKQQSEYTRGILKSIPGRQGLINTMVQFDKRKSAQIENVIITDNDRYFYLKTTPDDETGKLFYRDGFKGTEILLYDPLSYSTDTAKKYVISTFSPSIDGSNVAFDVALNGSESSVLLIMDVKNRALYPEKIDRCWEASPSWLPDNKSFLFNRLQSTDVHAQNRELDSKSFLHTIGKDPAKDKEILSRAKYPNLGMKPEDIPIVFYDKESTYLYGILATVDNRMNVYYAPAASLRMETIDWKRLFKSEDEVYHFVATDKDIYAYTPKDAANYKIVKTPLKTPDLTHAVVIVPEDPHAKLSSFGLTTDGLYYTLSKNGVEEKLYHLPSGANKAVELKLPFTAGSISLNTKGPRFSDVWATISGWTSDDQRYRYVAHDNVFKAENLSTIAQFPEYNDLVVEELMIPGHDGVEVPLSLIYKKNIVKNGANPVLINGYGAYGYSLNPFFSPEFLLWTNEGGILAIAHIRGGSELGNGWYKAGYKTTKPNTWKDLISCAEYLVAHKYTSAHKIAITGGSAGGILIGRAMTERPDLFAVAIPKVGCLNPLRGEESPNGPVNAPEFGTVKDSVECMALIEMDSYLHIRDGINYPATLVTAGMNDPRVIVWQPAKFAARLQAANASGKPVLLCVDFEAGHGIGNTKSKSFESRADAYSFAFWQTGHPKYQVQ
jgi:prolyl oligopeptidase